MPGQRHRQKLAAGGKRRRRPHGGAPSGQQFGPFGRLQFCGCGSPCPFHGIPRGLHERSARAGNPVRDLTARTLVQPASAGARCLAPAPDLVSSLRCKRRLKAVICEFRNRYRQFESTSLRQRVSGLKHSPGKCANCARAAAIRTAHRHRRTLKWCAAARHFDFLSGGE
jgi:hypothetical protein